jgi:hypothetical protein
MGERPKLFGNREERPAKPIEVEHGPEPPRADVGAIGVAVLRMADFAPQHQSRLVQRLSVEMRPQVRQELKEVVAQRITKYLELGVAEYSGYGGLTRLVNKIAEETGWTKFDVYNLALREAKNVEFDLLSGTIKKITPESSSQ